MELNSLSVVTFKSIVELNASFKSGVNCITGLNGVGKTNVLEAINYLALGRGFSAASDRDNIHRQSACFLIQGHCMHLTTKAECKISCGYNGTKKQLQYNGKVYSKLSEHVGKLPLVLMSTLDDALVNGGSDERRKFIDGILVQYSSSYMQHLMAYKHALEQRNALLKQFAATGRVSSMALEPWNLQLSLHGTPIAQARAAFIVELLPYFQEYYELLGGAAWGKADVNYQSQLLQGDSFEQLLQCSFKKDCALQHTSVGVHRDDLLFYNAEFLLRKAGSQGQKKAYVIALKLAQLKLLKSKMGFYPLFLIDDFFAFLDEHRIKQLANVLSDVLSVHQSFITDAHEDRLVSFFGASSMAVNLS